MQRNFWIVSGRYNGKLFAKAFVTFSEADSYLRKRFEAGALVYLDCHSYNDDSWYTSKNAELLTREEI